MIERQLDEKKSEKGGPSDPPSTHRSRSETLMGAIAQSHDDLTDEEKFDMGCSGWAGHNPYDREGVDD